MRATLGARVALAAALGVMLAPALVRAQDHVNVTIVAPTLGSFPVLAAGSFDVTNQDQLVSHTTPTSTGQSQKVTMVGATEPVKMTMMLPWGSEVTQLVKAMTSSTPSVIDHITCDFVHAGSSQPYYTVVIDKPVLYHMELVYDSATATATEQLAMKAPQVEFDDGSTTSPTASGSAASAPRVMLGGVAQPKLRLIATPAMLRRLTTIAAAGMAGPPVVGFATFAATGSSGAHFAPEGSFPAWATGAMANVEALTITFDRAVIDHKQTSVGGAQTTVPLPGPMSYTTATFIKPVGSLSNDLQAAISGRQRVTTTFELSDVPGRLAYAFQFTSGFITSDHTTLSNGRATEQVVVTSGGALTVTNLRSNVSAQAQ